MKGAKTKTRLILSFCFPAALFIAACALLQVTPFGQRTLLVYDMKTQYLSFFGALKHALASGEGLAYSMGMQLGASTAGLAGYYLLSPFNLLFLLFPLRLLDMAVTLVTALKVGAAGLCFAACARDMRSSARETPLLALSYALCGYVTVFFHNLMWLDGVILAPLVYAGIRRLIDGRGAALYVAALAAAIATCYYIGYMLCIFSVLVFLTALPLSGAKRRSAARFAASSLLAGALSAIVWLPAVLALSGGKAAFRWPEATWRISLTDVLLQLRTGAFSSADITYGPPNLFCGALAVLLFALSAFNAKLSRKERLHMLLLFAALVLCICQNVLCSLLHGLNEPTWFPYRFSFLLSLVVILGAQMCLRHIGDLRRTRVFAVFGAIVCLYGLCALRLPQVSLKGFAWDAALLAVCALCLCLGGHARIRLMALIMAVTLSVGANTLKTMQRLLAECETTAFCDAQEATQSRVQALKAADADVYRVENAQALNVNDALLHGYAGLTHYSSMGRYDVRFFLRTLGYRDNGIFAKYAQGASLAADALLGIRYVLADASVYAGLAPSNIEQAGAFVNPYALPVAFACERAGALRSSDSEPFVRISEIYGQLAPGGQPVFAAHEGGVRVRLEGAAETQDGAVATMSGAPYGDVVYTLTAQREAPLYFYVPLDEYDCEIGLIVQGVTKDAYQAEGCFSTRYLGTFAAGETVEVRLRLMGGRARPREPQLYYEDTQALSAATRALQAGGVRWSRFTQDAGEGSFVAQEDGALLFTLPTDGGFEVLIDGERVQTQAAFGLFLSAEVSAGRHTVRFRYRPRGLAVGAFLTAGGGLACAAWAILRRRAAKTRI